MGSDSVHPTHVGPYRCGFVYQSSLSSQLDGGRGAGVLGVACSYFRDCPLPHIAHDGDNGEVLFWYLECQRDLN